MNRSPTAKKPGKRFGMNMLIVKMWRYRLNYIIIT